MSSQLKYWCQLNLCNRPGVTSPRSLSIWRRTEVDRGIYGEYTSSSTSSGLSWNPNFCPDISESQPELQHVRRFVYEVSNFDRDLRACECWIREGWPWYLYAKGLGTALPGEMISFTSALSYQLIVSDFITLTRFLTAIHVS